MSPGVPWGTLRDERPDLAEAGRELFYQYGVGLAYLGTVRLGGGPRVHPMCPVITDAGLYGFIIPSPKQQDLRRDGMFAMHSYATETNEDAFSITGRARPIDDPALRSALEAQFRAERPGLDLTDLGEQGLFEFMIDSLLLTRTTGHGDPNPRHEIWHAVNPRAERKVAPQRNDASPRGRGGGSGPGRRT
jgi:hypothetical protein